MTHTPTTPTIKAVALVLYVIALCLAYHQGGTGMVVYTAFTMVGGWVVSRSNYSN